MKTKVYKVIDDEEHLNVMGENGWEIFSKRPIIIGHPFKMKPNATILDQWVALFEYHANHHPKTRIQLNNEGFRFRKIYVDELRQKAYRMVYDENSPLYKWRVEFATSLGNPNGEEPILGITFGSPELNIPAFCDAKVIDEYVPKEIIDTLKEHGCIEEAEMETEDKKEEETEVNPPKEG